MQCEIGDAMRLTTSNIDFVSPSKVLTRSRSLISASDKYRFRLPFSATTTSKAKNSPKKLVAQSRIESIKKHTLLSLPSPFIITPLCKSPKDNPKEAAPRKETQKCPNPPTKGAQAGWAHHPQSHMVAHVATYYL